MCDKPALLTFICLTTLVCWGDGADTIMSQCTSGRSSIMRLSLTSRRNQTGHWMAQVQIDRDGRHDIEDLHPINMDMERTTSSCEGFELVSILATITVPPGKPGPDYELVHGFGYYKMHTKPLIWTEAKATCAREGAHLAIINSEEESRILKSIFNRHPNIQGAYEDIYAFIGIHDMYEEGKFETIFGDPLSSTGFNQWVPGQPNNIPIGNDKDQDCGGVSRDGTLTDLPCNSKYAFFCEREL